MKSLKQLISLTGIMIIGSITQITQAASAVRIEIEVPGVPGRIPAVVSPSGDVKIESYPEAFTSSLRLVAMASPTFGRSLSEAACDAVAQRAALATDRSFPADLRKIAADAVRKDNTFTLEAQIAHYFGTSDFTRLAEAAAVATGVRASSYQITNPLFGTEFEVRVEFSEDAISRKIGDTEFAAKNLKDLIQTSSGLSTGKSVGEISAADLVCDLRSGAAKVEIRLVGSVQGEDRSEPLFSAEAARAFYEGLKDKTEEVPAQFSAQQKLVMGGILAAEAAAFAQVELDVEATGVVATKLFDGRTGRFVEVPLAQLQDVLSVPVQGQRYEAQGTLTLN